MYDNVFSLSVNSKEHLIHESVCVILQITFPSETVCIHSLSRFLHRCLNKIKPIIEKM